MSFSHKMTNFATHMAIKGKKIAILLSTLVCLFLFSTEANAKYVLVIDPGHGGRDAGAIGKISKEKTINLNVALAFGRYVENNCPDVSVVYTRKTDVFIPLHERANIANRHKADLFISIHTNALPRGRKARGLETYTLGMHRAADNLDVAKRENSVILIESDYQRHYEGFDPGSAESYIMFEFLQDRNMEQSVEMARLIQKRTCAVAGRNNMGVKQAGFLVLRETSMPGCLVELGFISTPDEERYLNTKGGIDALGRGLYQAFVEYKGKLNRGSAVVSEPAPTKKVNDDEVQASKKKEQQILQPVQSETVKNKKATVSDAEPEKEKPTEANESVQPVFKVQIASSTSRIKTTDKQFKGLANVGSYQENGLYKYTYGSSENYNEIYRLRKEVAKKFPQAFIVAFKGTEKVNVNEAIKEFKQNRNKK